MRSSTAPILTLLLLTPAARSQDAPAPEQPTAERPFPLIAGDPAPPFTVSRWIARGPHQEVQRGKPYVVEFWSAWCMPCIAAIPHLTQLQRKYGERATIVWASLWESEPGEAEAFVREQGDRIGFLVALDAVPAMPESEQEYRMWTYRHGEMSRAWMDASGQTGIPKTFIVDARGRIAWIGEPREMDGPLADIVAGRWDLAAYAKEYRAKMWVEARSRPIRERLDRCREAHDSVGALAACDELLALGPSMARFAGDKFEILLVGSKDAPRAYAFGREAVARFTHNDRQGLTRIASVILASGEPERDLDLALAAAQRAAEITDHEQSRVLKLLAEVHAARNEWKEAAQAQQRAVSVAYEFEKPEFQQQLDGYERRAKGL